LGAFEEPIMVATLRVLVISCACLLGWGGAMGCVIGVPHPTIYVGSAGDAKCDYTRIQDAITAVSSSATCPPNIVISNKPNNAPWNEALTISGRSLALIGSPDSCTVNGAGIAQPTQAAATSPQAIISGAGLGASVITITGNSNVTVQSLEITGGSVAQSSDGGGIAMEPIGTGAATLTLQADTLTLNNTAVDGGGIYLFGSTRMYMLSGGSTVSFNTAGYLGGGIAVWGARADIASPGAGFVSAVSNNSAPNGGGIAMIGFGGDATVRLFSTSATQPAQVSQNSASSLGGAFYLDPDGYSTTLCAYSYRIDDNTAPDGAAIYADDTDESFDSDVYFNPSGNCGPESPTSLGAVACAPGTPCNEFSDNFGVDGGGNPIGAVISMHSYDTLAVEGLMMRGNHAAQMISADTGYYYGSLNYLHSCLIADNHSGHELISSPFNNTDTGAPLTIANCTLANNTIDNGYAIFAGSGQGITLTDSIIDQPANLALDCEGCSLDASYLMSSDISTLPSSSNIIAINPSDPLFVDAANGNYHLVAYTQNFSLHAARAIDFAPTVGGDAAHDLEGNAYGVDVPTVPDLYGTRDLGAFEALPISDRIFGDTFGDRLSLVY
jgi:hypothetical protein